MKFLVCCMPLGVVNESVIQNCVYLKVHSGSECQARKMVLKE